MSIADIVEKELLAIGIRLQADQDGSSQSVGGYIFKYINCEAGNLTERSAISLLLDISVALIGSRFRFESETIDIITYLNSNLEQLSDYERGCFWHLEGYLSWRISNELYKARREFNRSVALLEGAGSDSALYYLPRVFDSLGQLYHHQGIYPEAIAHFSESLNRREAINDEVGMGITLGNLGRLYLELGKYDEAADFFRRDLELLKKDPARNRGVIVQMLSHLGFCAFHLGENGKAEEYYTLCLAKAEQADNYGGIVFACLGMGELSIRAGKFEQTEKFFKRVKEVMAGHDFDAALDAIFKARSSFLKAKLTYALNGSEEALAEFNASYDLFNCSVGISSVEKAEFLLEFARVCNQSGKDQQAAEIYRKALHLLEGTEAVALQAELETELKKSYKESWLLHTAGRFIGQKSITGLLEQSGALGFHGEVKDLVILFSDIRGFTTIIEKNLNPDRVISFLNDYLRNMTRCVDYYGGVTNRFIGDAIVALFTVPETRKDDPERAVSAALAMYSELEAVNSRSGELFPEIDIGIGIHSGEVITGLIGSPQKRSFDIIGDAANTASRLESLTKHLGASVLVSENIYSKLPKRYIIRPLGAYCLKGKSNPIAIADVVGEDDGSLAMEALKREIVVLKEALSFFSHRRFEEACSNFQKLIDLVGEKSKRALGYSFLFSKSESYLKTPPGQSWAGEIVLDFK